MKRKLFRQILIMSRVAFYGLCFLGFGSSMLVAKESHAQELKITDVYITVDWQDVHVSGAFSEIERQTDFFFAYEDKLIRKKSEVRIHPGRQSVADVLEQISQQTHLKFQQMDQYILVGAQKAPMPAHIKRFKDTLTPSLRPESGQYRSPVRVPMIKPAPVSGTVRDEAGNALAGATVRAKDTNQGVLTDSEGRFQLNLPEGVSTLIISYIGYETQEVNIAGRASIDVVLVDATSTLEDVVITSFGLEKTQKSIVYAIQDVSGEELAKVGNPNLLNGLQGKVAGVSVSLNSGMPGRSPSIKIRGSRSISGNNQPLFVVDGAPISGNIQDINPSNIESINILKGPAASALYGLRASNGVVLITTKTGKANAGKPSIQFETFYSMDEVAYLPDLQTTFAQGANGAFNANGPFAWGPRISELGTYTNQAGEQEVARSYDNDKAFYEAGGTSNTNFSISNAGTIGNYTLGVGHNAQGGIVPGTDLRRTNLNFNSKLYISDRFSATVSFNYSDLNYNDYPDLAGNDDYFRSLRDVPPSYNLAGTPFVSAANPYSQRYFRGAQNNPYWVVNNNYRNTTRPRTLGNVLLEYELFKDLKLNYRLGVDNFSSKEEDFRELGTAQQGRTNPPSGGRLAIENQRSNQINSNAFITYQKQINEGILLDVVVGNEIFDQNNSQERSVGSNFVTGGWANLANATLIQSSNFESRQRIVGFYGNVNVGWQDMVFLNASGRNDHVSNMPAGQRSFFYPSVGASFILTNIVPSLEKVMSYAKLRANWAEVGQAGPLFVNGVGFVGNNPGGFTFPYNGIASFAQQTTRINPNLEPENTRSYELGLDFRFFGERVTLDYTYFNSTSEGQIFQVPLALSTGAASEIRNAGEISSKGHEIILGLTPVSSPSFSWNFTTNFSTLDNKVISLAEGVERIDINSGVIVAETGFDYPSIAGFSYQKDPATGQDVIESNPASPRYGFPILISERNIIGSALPDFEMNFLNRVAYKDLSLSFQVDWRSGGQIFSQSFTETRWRGVAGITRDREEEDVLSGVKGTLVNGVLVIEGPNDIPVKKDFAYYNAIGAFNATEQSLQDASFIRLREIIINYDLPEGLLEKTFLSAASVYLSGRNLFLISDSFTDPEVNFTDGRSGNTAGLEWSQIPQTRSVGAGIRITF